MMSMIVNVPFSTQGKTEFRYANMRWDTFVHGGTFNAGMKI